MARPVTKRTAAPDVMRAKIRDDFLRACPMVYMIQPRGGKRLVPFEFYPEQKRQAAFMVQQERAGLPVRILKLKARQDGDSTLAAAWTFHHVHWWARTRGIVVAHDDEATKTLYEMSQTIYQEIPPELQHPIRKNNRRELLFEPPHGSILMTATAGWAGIGRSKSIQHAHLSEADYYPDPPTVLAGVIETVPMAEGTSVIVESTANAASGWLQQYWNATKAGRTPFTPMFSPWYQVPEYRLPVTRPLELTKEEKERSQRFGLSYQQIAWWRAKESDMIAREPWGGRRKCRQEFPDTDLDAFQSAGMCIFPDNVLSRLETGVAVPRGAYRMVPVGDSDYTAAPCDIEHADLWVWRRPDPGRRYVLGIDVSEGVGQSESVIQVLAYPGYEQVAEWASNRTSADRVAWIAYWLSKRYGGAECLIVPEANKDGVLVLYVLQHIPGEFNIFRWRYFDRPGQAEETRPRLGWSTNHGTKSILAQVANLLYQRGDGSIRSAILHEQMKRCIDLVPGKQWGAEGGRSDRVLAWMIAQVGAFLDFEGGVAQGIGADHSGETAADPKDRPKYRDPGTYDGDDAELVGAGGHHPGAYLSKEDLGE